MFDEAKRLRIPWTTNNRKRVVKLDYLRDGTDDCPLIRLYEFQSEEMQRLQRSFERLASGAAERVALDEVTPIESVDGTQLTFSRAASDNGVASSGQQSFEVQLTPRGWRRCVELLEPFCKSSSGYQWLCDDVGDIRLLVSHDGAW